MTKSNYWVLGEKYDPEIENYIDVTQLLPKKISNNFLKLQKDLSVFIDTVPQTGFEDSVIRLQLFIINKCDSAIHIPTLDQRLMMVAEVLYRGKWKPIEYLIKPWCGNSYFDIKLSPNTYWEIYAAKYSGNIRTKLRYKLKLNNKYILSNEIWTNVNLDQMNYASRDTTNSKVYFEPIEFINFEN